MRVRESTSGRSHDALTDVAPAQHHPAPELVTIDNTSQVIAAGADYNLDVSLSSSLYRLARAQLQGPEVTGGGSGLWREGASVHASRTAAEAMGHSTRDGGSAYKSYVATYAKSAGASLLTHKIFDSTTGGSNRYIALKDAQIVGAVLRLTFHNYDASARTLWVKGLAWVA